MHRKNVVLARFYLGGTGFTPTNVQQFCIRLRDRLRSVPGIEDATYADYAPLGSNAGPYDNIEVEGYAPAKAESMSVNRYQVSPGYFGLLQTPLLEGRDFTADDGPRKAPVLIVNQTFVRKYFHGGAALGHRVRLGGAPATVIGVVRDTKYFDIAEAPRPHFFVPFLSVPSAGQQAYFFIKSGQPEAVMAGLRREVMAVDPSAGAFDVMLLTEWTEVTLLPQKAAASLAAGLGLISLLLAAVGLYSVMAYAVTQRTQEIGIRMALGAQRRDILSLIFSQTGRMVGAGVAIGLAASFLATRYLGALLFEISTHDPLAYVLVPLFLAFVAFLACWLPARRATKVDPLIALRHE
jgi:predicted permease